MLSEDLANQIEGTLLGAFFPWYYTPFTAYGKQFETVSTQDSPQFTHGFYANKSINSTYYKDIVTPILDILPESYTVDNLIRAKANLINMNEGYPEGHYNIPHSDIPDMDTISLIYYVNDSDGDTVFFEQNPEDFSGYLTIGKTFTPKKNQGILFNSKRLHASVPPRKTNARVILNFVFENKGV